MTQDTTTTLIKHVDFAERKDPHPRTDGRDLSRKTVSSDKIKSVDAATLSNGSVTQALLANNSVGQAQWKYEQATVAVNAAASSGTATVTSGDIIVGYYPSTNQDQIVKSISISGTTLTITLLANATAQNQFVVTLLKS